MWVLPFISALLGAISLAMFIWVWLTTPTVGASRLATAMRDLDGMAPTPAPTSAPERTGEHLDGLSRLMRRQPWVDRLQLELLRADWVMRPSEFIVFSFFVGCAGAIGAVILVRSAVAMVVGLVLAQLVVWFVLKSRQASRNHTLSAQLPDMLSMLSSSLRAGFSVGQAMALIQAQSAPPIAQEFRRALEEIRLGQSQSEALESMVVRTGNYDLALVVSAIQTQLEIGGNMAEVLDRIAAMIRERVQLKSEIAIAASEGRISSVVLLALPVIMAVLIQIINPHYLDPLTGTLPGRMILGVAVALMVIGGLVLHRLTQIDV